MSVWHLALTSDWERAVRDGAYDVSTRGARIDQVGYLHASRDLAQADAVARRFYADVTEPLLLLEIDEDALAVHGLSVRLEPADPSRPAAAGEELFPHVYGGDLPLAAIASRTPYEPGRHP